MSYSDNSSGWTEFDEDDLPDLMTEEGRDSWIEILMAQDDEAIAANGGWCRSLVVADDDGNMVMRIAYPDGRQELFDLQVRRAIDVSLTEVRN